MTRVNPFGIALLALGVLIVALAGRISRQGARNVFKLLGLFAAMGGALLAICG